MTFYSKSARLRSIVTDISRDLFRIIPTAILVFITSAPTQALAYANVIKESHQPLVFVRDPSLADQAILGLDLMSAATAGDLLLNRASTIRRVIAGQIRAGAAVRVLAFAYSSDMAQTDANPYTTASGSTVRAGTMAANFLPFGTQVRIGNAVYTVQDRMNERYSDKYVVDLWQPSRAAAIKWGARVVEMEIVSLP